MITAKFATKANSAHDQWVDLALPYKADHPSTYKLAALDPLEGRAPTYAIKGRNLGYHSTMFHVPVSFLKAQDSFVMGLLPENTNIAQVPFHPSDWVADDIQALIPVPVAVFADDPINQVTGTIKPPVLVQSNSALQTWKVEADLTHGLRMVAYVDIYSLQDACPIKLSFTWSNRDDENWSMDLLTLALKTGEILHLKHGPKWDVGESYKVGNYWLTPLIVDPTAWGDAQSMEYYGWLLCLPNTPLDAMFLTGPELAMVQRRLNNLLALKSGCGYAVASRETWNGNWLHFGMVPDFPTFNPRPSELADAADRRVQAFDGFQQGAGTMWDERPLGMAKRAGQTGSQEDFGSTKGSWAVSAGDPRWIEEGRYSCSEVFRGVQHRERDGSRLKFEQHKGWRTWSGLTHVVSSETTDTLGKSKDRPYEIPGSNYTGLDNQHRSQNLSLAVYALTGDYLLEDMFLDYVENDLAMHRDFMDSPRGARMLQVWAGMHRLLPADGSAQIEIRMREHTKLYLDRWIGKQFLGDPLKTVRWLDTGADPTLGYDKTAAIIWEHGLHMIGVAAANRILNDPELDAYMLQIGQSIMLIGCFKYFDTWHCCTAVEYQTGALEGVPLPLSAYIGSPKRVTIGDEGWWDWILPGILIWRDLVRRLENASDKVRDEYIGRADEIIAQVTAGGPWGWPQSEWWACVRKDPSS